jgi:hypothetical protein
LVLGQTLKMSYRVALKKERTNVLFSSLRRMSIQKLTNGVFFSAMTLMVRCSNKATSTIDTFAQGNAENSRMHFNGLGSEQIFPRPVFDALLG